MEGRVFECACAQDGECFSHSVRQRAADMGCLRGCGSGERKLVSKALPCVLVIFCLLVSETAVAVPLVANVSRSVSSAVQESLSTEEVVALQEIARALKRMTANTQKVSLLGFWGAIGAVVLAMFTGVSPLYLSDLGRKKWPHWKSLRPSPFTPFTRELSARLDALGVQIAAALERMATTIAHYVNELAGLQAKQANHSAVVDALQVQVVNQSAVIGVLQAQAAKQSVVIGALQVQVRNQGTVIDFLQLQVTKLQNQLDAKRIADAERKDKQMLEFIEECLRDSKPRTTDVLPDPIEGLDMSDADAWREGQ